MLADEPVVTTDIREILNQRADKLLAHVEQGTTESAGGIFGVPSQSYTDPVAWGREVDVIFKRLPQLLAFSSEIPNPGDFKTLELVGVPVLVTRLADGRARAFLNVCQHRGARVATLATGNARRFTCRYHGWTYANDGRLIGIADRANFGEPGCRLDLVELACVERAGMVFGVLTPGIDVDFDEFLGGMSDELGRFDLGNWQYLTQHELTGANWKVAYDGYLENYHFRTLHAETLAPRSVSGVMTFTGYGPHFCMGLAGRAVLDLKSVPPQQRWSKEPDSFRVLHLVFPNLAGTFSYGVGQVAQVLPGPTWDTNRTLLHHLVPKAPASDAERAQLMEVSCWLRDVVRDEDYSMGVQVQEGLIAGGIRTVLFGRNERGNHHFHKWVAHLLEGGALAEGPRF